MVQKKKWSKTRICPKNCHLNPVQKHLPHLKAHLRQQSGFTFAQPHPPRETKQHTVLPDPPPSTVASVPCPQRMKIIQHHAPGGGQFRRGKFQTGAFTGKGIRVDVKGSAHGCSCVAGIMQGQLRWDITRDFAQQGIRTGRDARQRHLGKREEREKRERRERQ